MLDVLGAVTGRLQHFLVVLADFRRTLRLELGRFTENGSSDLVSRFTNDLDGVTAGIQTFYGRLLLEPLKAIACLAVALALVQLPLPVAAATCLGAVGIAAAAAWPSVGLALFLLLLYVRPEAA